MMNQLCASLTGAFFFLGSSLCLVLSLASSAVAAPIPLKIEFADQGGLLEFSLLGTNGPVSREQLSFSLSDERKTLLKIEVDEVEISNSKYWIKSFTESKSDPDVKGIMVRHDKTTKRVQIRVRYKKRIMLSEKSMIKVIDIPNGVKVIAPRVFKEALPVSMSQPPSQKETPKPSLDPKLSKINNLTSRLADEQPTPPNLADGRPSVFDKGTPVAPLPKMEPLRSTQVVKPSTAQLKVSQTNPTITTTRSDLGASSSSTVKPVKPQVGSLNSMKTSKSIGQKSMYSLETPKPVGSQPSVGNGSTSIQSSDSPFDLEQLSSLVSYAVLFLLLLWVASFFFKRGQALDSVDGGNAIKVLSQKVVSLSPRQRIMVVETLGHTFVVGSCEKGGLSHIAHLSTPNGPVGGTTFQHNQYSDFEQSQSRLDALGRFDDQREYYSDRGYPIEEQNFQRSEASGAEVGVTYDENTFVGEDEVFTSEMLPVNQAQHPNDQMSSSDAYHQPGNNLSMDQIDQYSSDELMVASANEVGAQGFDIGEDEEDVNMKPGDLLQWIQKLNGTKG